MNNDAELSAAACALDDVCRSTIDIVQTGPGRLTDRDICFTFRDIARISEMTDLIVRCKQLLTRAMSPQGFNIGLNINKAAGAGVLDHLHWHIVPRWEGDNNFMPVTADVRVLPQALEELHAELLKHLTDPAQ